MDSAVKHEKIRYWIDPQERVTVDFLDEQNLNAAVMACTDEYVELSIQTRFPHLKQTVMVPLSKVEVAEDPAHYTRDPDRPLRFERLRLSISMKRPKWT